MDTNRQLTLDESQPISQTVLETPHQKNKQRRTSYNDAPNCSLARIKDNRVFIFDRELYNTNNTNIDYSKGKGIFIYKGIRDSLNQDPDAPRREFETVEIPLLLSFEIFKAFKELDEENDRKVKSLFT